MELKFTPIKDVVNPAVGDLVIDDVGNRCVVTRVAGVLKLSKLPPEPKPSYGHKKDGSLHLSPEAAKALQHALDWIGWAENPHAQDLQSEARIKVVNRLREFMNIAINTSNASFSVYT